MYGEEILNILTETYDKVEDSYEIDGYTNRENMRYFYSLAEDYKSEITAIQNALSSLVFANSDMELTEMQQMLNLGRWELPQWVCYSETDEKWGLTFHCILGVKYYKT